jgi:hypothetical protein
MGIVTMDLLSPEQIEKIKTIRYDRILEKHEGPWDYDGEFEYGHPEFMHFNGRSVLLPVEDEQHQNITMLRDAISADDLILTLFLKDTTYVSSPEDERYFAGRLAICEKMPGEEFYIATVYHECFLVENPVLR